MNFSARELADILDGELVGDANVIVNKISKIEECTQGSISFLANPHYTQYIYTTKASVVIVNKDFSAESKIISTLIKVNDPYSSFAKLLELYLKN